jgi:tetratricopeptide (TPR) repeat protein
MIQLASGASAETKPLFVEAGRIGRDLVSEFPDDLSALEAVARLYQRLGNTKEAIRCWEQCLAREPALAITAHAAIADMAFERGDFERAAEHFRLAMERDPSSAAYPVQLGESLISLGKPGEAVQILEENWRRHPQSMPTAAMLGQAYLKLGQYAEARRCLEASVRDDPNYPAAFHALATACTQLGDAQKAAGYRQRFRELQATKEQRHRQELKARDDVRRLRATVAATHTDAARVYLTHSEPQAAETHLRRAGELAPEEGECLLLLAGLYEQQGRISESLTALASARERLSSNLLAQLSIAAAYRRMGLPGDAEKAYRRMIELAPRQASTYAALAQFYLQTGQKPAQAQSLAQQAVEREATPAYWFLLAQVCFQNGDRAAARNAIERALALDASNSRYRQFQERLRE